MNELKLRRTNTTTSRQPIMHWNTDSLTHSRLEINIPATVKISDKSVNDNYCSCRRVHRAASTAGCSRSKNPNKPSLYGMHESINNRNLSVHYFFIVSLSFSFSLSHFLSSTMALACAVTVAAPIRIVAVLCVRSAEPSIKRTSICRRKWNEFYCSLKRN